MPAGFQPSSLVGEIRPNTETAEIPKALNQHGNAEKTSTAQKMKFSIKDFLSKCDQIHSFLRITFTGEIPNGKLHFLCNE